MERREPSIQTMIQTDPEVRVSVGYRESSALRGAGYWYWESWCFSDHPRLKSFTGSTCCTREKAQDIHDSIVRCVRRKLKEIDHD